MSFCTVGISEAYRLKLWRFIFSSLLSQIAMAKAITPSEVSPIALEFLRKNSKGHLVIWSSWVSSIFGGHISG